MGEINSPGSKIMQLRAAHHLQEERKNPIPLDEAEPHQVQQELRQAMNLEQVHNNELVSEDEKEQDDDSSDYSTYSFDENDLEESPPITP